MDCVILGGGGIGSVCAALLSRGGHRVRLVTRGAHLDAVRASGLTVSGRADFTVDLDAVDAAVGPCDVFLLATKTFDTREALERVSGLRPALALSLQNGVAKDDELIEIFGAEHVLGATTMIGATRTGPGLVEYTQDAPTMIGELSGSSGARSDDLATAGRAAGLDVRAVEDIRAHEWAKQALQAGASPLAALTGLPTYQLFGQPSLARSLVSIVREVGQVAAALGVRLTDDDGYGFDLRRMVEADVEDGVRQFVERGRAIERAGKTNVIISMAQDVRAGRRTEIEETVGHVLGEARRLGVETPHLAFVYDLVTGIERAGVAR